MHLIPWRMALQRILDDLLPNNSPSWRDWKGGILDKIRMYPKGEDVFASMSSSRGLAVDSVGSPSPAENSSPEEESEYDAFVVAAKAYEYYRTCQAAGHVAKSIAPSSSSAIAGCSLFTTLRTELRSAFYEQIEWRKKAEGCERA